MTAKDMSVGKPLKVLFAFALPMIVSVLFQQFYNIADSLIAGNFINDEGQALAAVNAAYPVTVVFIAVGNGFGVGGGVVISRIFGAKQFKRTKTACSSALFNIILFAIIFTVLGIFTCKPLLTLMNSEELGKAVFSQSADYLNIYIYGLTFLFLYNVVSSSFQALGNSKTPLFLLIFSTLFNVAVDIIFVKYFNMGVKGLAWGTFLAQGIASLTSLAILLFTVSKLTNNKSKIKDVNTRVEENAFGVNSAPTADATTVSDENILLNGDATNASDIQNINDNVSCANGVAAAQAAKANKTVFENALFSFATWKSIMIMSLPSILQNSTVSIGQLFVQGLVNSFGNANLVAAYGSAFKINYIIISIFLTISNAMATFTSQNIGAKHLDRAKEGLKGGILSIIAIALLSTAIYLIFAKQLVGVFISSKNKEIIDIGSQFLYILAPFYIVVCIKIIFDGFIRGAGDMAGFTASTMTDLVLRVGLSFIFVKCFDLSYVSIWWSWPIGWVVGAAVSVCFYLSKRWQKTALKKL